MPSSDEHNDESETIRLLKENTELVRENNQILRRLRRNSAIDLWLRVLWYAFLIGLPFLLYFYILEPYLKPFETSFQQFRLGTFPGIEVFQEMLKAKQP